MDKAFFPYGDKSLNFLIKRTIYLCRYLQSLNVDKIILACNTLSLLVLDFIKIIFKNVYGVFDSFLPFINSNSVFIGSYQTSIILKNKYKNNLIIDGSYLIYLIQNNYDYSNEIERINTLIKGHSNIILACTHFIKIKDNSFIIKEYKNI